MDVRPARERLNHRSVAERQGAALPECSAMTPEGGLST